jgi:hypothetical protein
MIHTNCLDLQVKKTTVGPQIKEHIRCTLGTYELNPVILQLYKGKIMSLSALVSSSSRFICSYFSSLFQATLSFFAKQKSCHFGPR